MAAEAKVFGRVHAKANGSGDKRAGGRMEWRPLVQTAQAFKACIVARGSRSSRHAREPDGHPSRVVSTVGHAKPRCCTCAHANPASSASPVYASCRPLMRRTFRSGNKVEHFAHKADVSGYEALSPFPLP